MLREIRMVGFGKAGDRERTGIVPILLTSVLLASCSPADGPGAASGGGGGADATVTGAADSRGAWRSVDLARHFDGVHGTFVLLDLGSGESLYHDEERARTRFLPASTFKIPNTITALETGVAAGPDFALTWDSAAVPASEWWPASWKGDHVLTTAFRTSTVWYYQELARRIGPERMGEYLERLDYGNRDISGGIDTFWLTDGLRISAEEQVEFLRRFYHDELGIDPRTTRVVKDLLVLEETPSYRLSGKTGWAGLGVDDAEQIGWLVGYLERPEGVYFFATNLEIQSPSDAAARMRITRGILDELGLLGEQ